MNNPLDIPERFFHQLKVVDGIIGDDPDCKCVYCERDKGKMENEIDVDEVYEIQDKRARINKIDIREAVFTRKGKILNISQKEREDFRFTGLATIDFVDTLL